MSESSLPPRWVGRPSTSRESAPRRRRKKSAGPNWITLVMGGVSVMGMLVGGLFYFGKHAAPKLGGIAHDIGLGGIVGDSPHAIHAEFIKAARELGAVLREVHDVPSAERTLPRLDALREKGIEIERRVMLLPPQSREEMTRVARSFEGEYDQVEREIEKIAEEFTDRPDLGLRGSPTGREFAGRLQGAFLAVASADKAFRKLTPLPEPKDEMDAVAMEFAQLRRDMVVALARIEAQEDIPQAATDLRTITPKLEALQERVEQLDTSKSGVTDGFKYRSYSNEDFLPILLASVRKKFGTNEQLEQAFLAADMAGEKYRAAMAIGGLRQRTKEIVGVPDVPPSVARAERVPLGQAMDTNPETSPEALEKTPAVPETETPQEGAANNVDASDKQASVAGPPGMGAPRRMGPPERGGPPGPPSVPFGPGGTRMRPPGFGGGEGMPRPPGAMESPASNVPPMPPVPQGPGGMAGTRGGRPGFGPPMGGPSLPASESVTVVMRGGPFDSPKSANAEEARTLREEADARRKTYVAQLRELSGSNQFQMQHAGGTGTLTLPYSGEIPAFAEKIPFGKVVSSDEKQRVITLDLAGE